MATAVISGGVKGGDGLGFSSTLLSSCGRNCKPSNLLSTTNISA
ncbi:hypothetical protein COLO4_37493 [Corchorus olitorius]|uniref:Uncharacterized protein n=1 Tax=Corchorus olitorius TaxID=93759 RepID=A0A1R3G1D5_9ROSI|nr:hypothetical protein COLO4_37493 [Corchorus olitorius]